jgi:chromosome segregation ATPase
MRSLILSLCMLSLVGLPGLASAQSLRQKCEAKKTELDGLRTQINEMDAQITAKGDKIEKVRKRLQMLEAERAKVLGDRQAATNRLKVEEAMREKMCKPLDHCGQMDARVAELQKRVSPLYEQLRTIRDEIRRELGQVGQLNTDISRIQNQYEQLKCEDLVPGQTAQATIDQCHNLFSEWNAAATRINQMETNVRALRTRYQDVIKRVQALNREIARLRGDMSRDCSDSQQFATLEAIDKERGEYENMGSELDDADKRVKQMKLLKLAPGKEKPRLKKAP